MILTCIPLESTSAADAVTLKSPAPVLADDQAEKLPLSKPSAKIRSEAFGVLVGVLVGVLEGPFVGVRVTVGVEVRVAVGPGVDVRVAVGVRVTVGAGPALTQVPLPESVKVCPAIGTNCQL